MLQPAQWVLAAGYLAVALLCAAQTAAIAYHRHRFRSFRVGFLLLSLLWTAVKGAFWLREPAGWSLLELILLSKVPTAGQLASYLFFLVFCAQHVHRRSWQATHGRRCWGFFALANAASVGCVVAFGLLASAESGSGSAALAEHGPPPCPLCLTLSPPHPTHLRLRV